LSYQPGKNTLNDTSKEINGKLPKIDAKIFFFNLFLRSQQKQQFSF